MHGYSQGFPMCTIRDRYRKGTDNKIIDLSFVRTQKRLNLEFKKKMKLHCKSNSCAIDISDWKTASVGVVGGSYTHHQERQ
jgi:hypothetical protein